MSAKVRIVGIVALPSGTVIHASSECPYLAKAVRLTAVDITDTYSRLRGSPCSHCKTPLWHPPAPHDAVSGSPQTSKGHQK